jgi:ABC-type molybdate transport system permease subunit
MMLDLDLPLDLPNLIIFTYLNFANNLHGNFGVGLVVGGHIRLTKHASSQASSNIKII